MSKTILANVDGFTPLIDDLVKKYGLVTAAVFGRAWRFCQGERGVCDASIEKIAGELRIDYRTTLRHMKVLSKDGYLKDMTPDLRNKPHAYLDTGKAGLEIGITAKTKDKSGMTLDQSALTLDHTGMTLDQSALTLDQSHSDLESHEDTSKKQVKKEIKIEPRSIPAGLNSPLFLEALAAFIAHRKEIRKPITETGYDRLLKKLACYSVSTAVEMLNQSIENGWQGVFEIKGRNGKQKPVPPPSANPHGAMTLEQRAAATGEDLEALKEARFKF